MSWSYPHSFPGISPKDEFMFTSNCVCGAWMGSCRSGGPSESSYRQAGFSPDDAKLMAEENDSGFSNCPKFDGYNPIYDRYPMDHRPVFVRNEHKRKIESEKIESLKGDGI